MTYSVFSGTLNPTQSINQDHPGEPVPEDNFWTLWCINRCRYTDRPAGCHSVQTNQCPPPPSPPSFRTDYMVYSLRTISSEPYRFLFLVYFSIFFCSWFTAVGLSAFYRTINILLCIVLHLICLQIILKYCSY